MTDHPYKKDRDAVMFLHGEVRAAANILYRMQTNRGPLPDLIERTAKYLDRLEKTLEEVRA